MSVDRVRAYFEQAGFDGEILLFDASSATVPLAAIAVGCEEARIAKTLSFLLKDAPVLIVAAGDARVDNRKFKDQFGAKAKMLTTEQAETLVGHAVGGVCPFAVNPAFRCTWTNPSAVLNRSTPPVAAPTARSR